MRFIIPLLPSLLVSLFSSAQKNLAEEESAICLFYCIEPRFPGGDHALKNFIANNFRTPDSYLDTVSTDGEKKMKIKFQITEKGKACCFEPIQSISPEVDSEAIRVLLLMPKWEPLIDKGKFKNSHHILPITILVETDTTQDCFDTLFVTKYTTTPATAIKLPHKANHPVEIKRNNQIARESITGTGNNHILKGKSFVPNF
jgi:hypothetical protein